MKRTILLFASIFYLLTCNAQTAAINKEQYKQNLKQKMMNFLDFKVDDNIADIGSGTGMNIVQIASFYPDFYFTVQDIDSTSCNKTNFIKQIKHCGNLTSIDKFIFKYGSEKSTNLPSATYSKVLMFDLVHELTYKTEMFNDIRRILRRDGTLIISEIVVHKKAPKEKNCFYPFFTENELIDVLQKNKILILKQEFFFNITDNKYMLMFLCKLK